MNARRSLTVTRHSFTSQIHNHNTCYCPDHPAVVLVYLRYFETTGKQDDCVITTLLFAVHMNFLMIGFSSVLLKQWLGSFAFLNIKYSQCPPSPPAIWNHKGRKQRVLWEPVRFYFSVVSPWKEDYSSNCDDRTAALSFYTALCFIMCIPIALQHCVCVCVCKRERDLKGFFSAHTPPLSTGVERFSGLLCTLWESGT